MYWSRDEEGLNNGVYGQTEGWGLGIGDLGVQMKSEGQGQSGVWSPGI